MKKAFVLFFLALFALSGCTFFKTSAAKDEAPQSGQPVLNQAFYGFPDVPVPKELKLNNERSFIYETTSLRAGVLVLSGNVELDSLENYFKVNMIKNGWKFINSFKFKDITMNFVKNDKTCNIKMSRDTFNADVEVWVGPSTSTSSSGSSAPDKIMIPKDNGRR